MAEKLRENMLFMIFYKNVSLSKSLTFQSSFLNLNLPTYFFLKPNMNEFTSEFADRPCLFIQFYAYQADYKHVCVN